MNASDLVIEALTDDEVLRLERIASLEDRVRMYRELAIMGLTALHDLTKQHRSLRDDRDRLRDQLRFIAEESWLRSNVDDLAREPSQV
jgi:hypothetical protein